MRILTLLLCLCLGGFIRPVVAQDEKPASRWSLRTDLLLTDFSYKEYDDNGQLLDREDGTLPGIALDLSHPVRDWTFGGRFAWHNGEVLYDGQTNTGTPVTSRTDENILDTSLYAERRWDAATSPKRPAVYAGAGYRYWSRNIRSTRTSSGQFVDGLFEIYRWRYVFLGGKAVLRESGASRWQLDLRALRLYRPTIEVDFSGNYDTVILDLGERTGWRLSLPWEFRWREHLQLVVEPYAEGWELGRSRTETLTSNGVPVGTVYEPRSTTRNLGLSVGIRQPF